jgi:ribosomal protein S16
VVLLGGVAGGEGMEIWLTVALASPLVVDDAVRAVMRSIAAVPASLDGVKGGEFGVMVLVPSPLFGLVLLEILGVVRGGPVPEPLEDAKGVRITSSRLEWLEADGAGLGDTVRELLEDEDVCILLPKLELLVADGVGLGDTVRELLEDEGVYISPSKLVLLVVDGVGLGDTVRELLVEL